MIHLLITSPSKGIHMREKLSQYQKKIGYKQNYFTQTACGKLEFLTLPSKGLHQKEKLSQYYGPGL